VVFSSIGGGNGSTRRKPHIKNLLSPEEVTNFKARSIALASALKIDWQMVIKENGSAVLKQLPMLPYHHPLNHQY
jgi:hypothetical protein